MNVLSIYFIKDNKVVYDYRYSLEYDCFEPLDQIIDKDKTIFVGHCEKNKCNYQIKNY